MPSTCCQVAIPKDSVLGPLLFLIHIDKVSIYTDDTASQQETPRNYINMLQDDITTICN